jgi:hypothetical protein
MARPERAEQERLSKAIDPNDKHLCTDHLLGDLKGRTISSGFITIAAQGVQFALSLARRHHARAGLESILDKPSP